MKIMTTFASALKKQCDFKVKKKFSKRINEGWKRNRIFFCCAGRKQ